MEKKSVLREFLHYAVMNVLGMIGLSCYILADTFFISKGLGADGLTALNLAIPVYSFVYGTGLMLGIGGAARYVILKNDRLFPYTIYMALGFSLFFMGIGVFGTDWLTHFLGANEDVYEMTRTYLQVVLLFSPFFILNQVLLCFVRNDGAPNLSMLGMLLGSFSNIVLDYIFIFPMQMGILGAVLATGFAPIISMAVLSWHFMKKKNSFHLKAAVPDIRHMGELLALGVPSLISEVASGVVIIVFNMIILSIDGNVGVAAYGVVANISLVVVAVYNGIAQGMQPLASRAYGNGDMIQLNQIKRYAMRMMSIISILIYVGIFCFADPIAAVFNSEKNSQLQLLAVDGLRLYFTCVLFVGYNIILSMFFSSTERPLPAQVLSLLRGILLVIPLAYLLSACLGITGVWLTLTVTEGIVAVIGLVYKNTKCVI